MTLETCFVYQKRKWLKKNSIKTFIRNIHDSHSVHTPQYDLLQVLTLVHGKCSSFQNLYLVFECNANNIDSRIRIFSTSLSNWDQRFSQQHNNHRVLYWLPFVDRTNRKYILISDDALWKLAIMIRLFVSLHVDPFQLWN